jgi:hypothetical protein
LHTTILMLFFIPLWWVIIFFPHAFVNKILPEYCYNENEY